VRFAFAIWILDNACFVDLTLSPSEQAFRDELRSWLAENQPGPEPTGARYDEDVFEYRRAWQRKLYEGGWAGVWWPKEYGGRGATLVEGAIFTEELARARAPYPVNLLGLAMGGPTLMTHGTPEQKSRFLPPILSADEIWCQGFSEPDAGSDFASLKTRAVRADGGWLLTGQKVWTSIAQVAKWCMLVARTDPDAPKHKGLTYFLLDMEQDAVEVRPLRQLTGHAEFNELFLEDAFVPDENVVGAVNDGWAVAMTTLMNERAGIGFGAQVEMKLVLDELTQTAAERGLLDGEEALDLLGDLHVRAEVLRLTAYRGLTGQMKRGATGPEGSLPKWMWSETNQRIAEAAAELLGAEALAQDSPWAYRVLRTRGNSIEGGTTEILKNIVAERVLGLPRLR
jgi:alkylation response protein AidB-like acyl-CoA dehydrogenase